ATRNGEKNPSRLLKRRKQARDQLVRKGLIAAARTIDITPSLFLAGEVFGRLASRRSLAHQHCARLASRSALVLTMAGAFGYLRGISPKLAQACSLAPSAFNDWPRRKRACGARGELAYWVETFKNCSAASRRRPRK